ncbi:TonB-dependent receptor [Limibacter armeniacum]|uniref:TonB-dependent receptor n=1 Tax=Limibacter armeniacum TaxID=466084 RepID=UPI002FE6BB7D
MKGQDLVKTRVHGSVQTSNGEKLIGVTVVLKGTTKGTTTNMDGDFDIKNIPLGDYVLQASFIGFNTKEVTLKLDTKKAQKLNIVLDENITEMDVVEVKGESLAQEVKKQPFAVTAVSTKEFYNSAADAKMVLNRVAGVRVMEEGGVGSNLNFTLNGFSGDQVKFFLDGIPMDNYGSSLSLSNIPVNSIERIDVYKGVVPVWLGTDALGGAVNIVTNSVGNFLDASYTVGSFNTHRVSVNGAYTNPKSGFTFRTNLNGNYSDNNYKVLVPIKEGNNIVDTAEVKRFHDRYYSGTLKLETGLVNKPYADQLLFGVILTGDDNQVQTGATMNTVYGGIVSNGNSIIPTLKYSKEDLFVEGLDVTLYNAYNISTHNVIDTLSGVKYNWLGEPTYTPGSSDGELSRTYSILDDKEFNSQLNASYGLDNHNSLQFNYSFSSLNREVTDTENPDKIENKFPKSISKHVLGLAYVYEPSEKWNTTVFGKYYFLKAKTSKEFDFGLETNRIEGVENSKQNFGYGLATTYLPVNGLQLKASYEHTYRLPWAYEMFGDGLFTQANPDLGPEQSDNFNLGAQYQFDINSDHTFVVESNLIYREAKDLIYQVVKVASPVTQYDNLSQTRAKGVEASINYTWKDFLRIGGNITYQDITDQADSVYNESYTNSGYQKNFQKGFRVPNIPYLFGNANVGVTFKEVFQKESVLNVNMYYNFVEQYFLSWAELGSKDNKKVIPGQSSVDMEVSYSMNKGKYNIALECRNLTGALLYDKYYLQKPGRAFYIKLRYVLGR